MDTPAQLAERDRAVSAASDDEAAGRRSRSVLFSRRAPRPLLSGRPGLVRPRCSGGAGGLRLRGGRSRTVAVVLLCGVAMLLAGRFVTQPYEIPSGSMEPGLRPGDRVLVNKLAYRFGAEPRRGDVVVFDGTGYFGGGDYVKRVVGVGGDRVVCCDGRGRIEVNGDPVAENRYLYPGDAASRVPFDVRVPDGALFLLGDHRSASRDSRDRLGAPGGGMVPVGAVIGKAVWVAWPASHWATTAGPPARADGTGSTRDGRLAGREDLGGRTAAAGLPRPPPGPAAPPGGAHG